MANIEFIWKQKRDGRESVERIEVRPWSLAGNTHQEFLIGSGANFNGTGTILLEIAYHVNDVQFFYTRNFVQYEGDAESAAYMEQRLDMFVRGEEDTIGFGDMLPDTSIVLERHRSTPPPDVPRVTYETYNLEINLDVGAVIGNEPPGVRMFNMQFGHVEGQAGIGFMRDLIQEIKKLHEGKRPNPADLPEGASEWSFVREMNRKAYDLIAEDYQEKYFSNPNLTELFDFWLAQFPDGSHILDAGCGHGDPVITRLLEQGFRVTGTDLSPRMLERARHKFPQFSFINQMVSDLRTEEEFDGACSFSSLLYLDPIDLSHSIYRLHRAIKPGGLLFLYAYDLHPDWRGMPYRVDVDQWMWSWCYGMEDAKQALEEFGCFQVLEVRDVTTEEQKEHQINLWKEDRQKQHEMMVNYLPPGTPAPPLDLTKVPDNLPYCYALIARREAL